MDWFFSACLRGDIRSQNAGAKNEEWNPKLFYNTWEEGENDMQSWILMEGEKSVDGIVLPRPIEVRHLSRHLGQAYWTGPEKTEMFFNYSYNNRRAFGTKAYTKNLFSTGQPGFYLRIEWRSSKTEFLSINPRMQLCPNTQIGNIPFAIVVT